MRDGLPSDRAFLDGLLEAEGMAAGADPSEFLVAECDGRIAGAARAEDIDGDAWVRPIAVAPSARGQGVGTVLIGELAARDSMLRVVARGATAGFYVRLGFTEMNWDEAPSTLRAECEQCPDASECRPVPMVRW